MSKVTFKKVSGGWEMVDSFDLQDGDLVKVLEYSADPVPFDDLPMYTVEADGDTSSLTEE